MLPKQTQTTLVCTVVKMDGNDKYEYVCHFSDNNTRMFHEI